MNYFNMKPEIEINNSLRAAELYKQMLKKRT